MYCVFVLFCAVPSMMLPFYTMYIYIYMYVCVCVIQNVVCDFYLTLQFYLLWTDEGQFFHSVAFNYHLNVEAL